MEVDNGISEFVDRNLHANYSTRSIRYVVNGNFCKYFHFIGIKLQTFNVRLELHECFDTSYIESIEYITEKTVHA